MKLDANGTPYLFKLFLRAAPGALRTCCLLLLSRPRLAQPWTAGSLDQATKKPEAHEPA